MDSKWIPFSLFVMIDEMLLHFLLKKRIACILDCSLKRSTINHFTNANEMKGVSQASHLLWKQNQIGYVNN